MSEFVTYVYEYTKQNVLLFCYTKYNEWVKLIIGRKSVNKSERINDRNKMKNDSSVHKRYVYGQKGHWLGRW